MPFNSPNSKELLTILEIEENRISKHKSLEKTYSKICNKRVWIPVYKADNGIEMLDYNNRSKVLAPTIKELALKGKVVDFPGKLLVSIDFEIGSQTRAKKEFLHTIYAPFYGVPSVYAQVFRMATRIAYRITADMH